VRRTAALVVFCAATGLSQAEAAERAVAPVPIAAACKRRPPVLLTTGRAPRAPLRFDLASMAGTSKTETYVATTSSKTLTSDGRTIATRKTTSKATATARAGTVAHGLLPTTTAIRVTGTIYPKPVNATVKGSTDILGGGINDGSPDTDHFPREAVGIGATWRVVNCNEIDQIPAKETRTYTLRAVHGGVADLTFTDIVAADPAHLDGGSSKQSGVTAHYKVVSISGSAAGKTSITFRDSLAETDHSVTRARVSLRVSASTGQKAVVHIEIVETEDLR
jgi:hypothetical protein